MFGSTSITIFTIASCVTLFASSAHSYMVACNQDNEGYATQIGFCFLWHCKAGNSDAWPIIERNQYPMCSQKDVSIDRNDDKEKCNFNGNFIFTFLILVAAHMFSFCIRNLSTILAINKWNYLKFSDFFLSFSSLEPLSLPPCTMLSEMKLSQAFNIV